MIELRTLIETSQDEFSMSKCLGRGQSTIGGAEHAIEQGVTGLGWRHLLAQQSRDVNVDMLTHGTHGTRIRAQLDDR